MNRKFFHSFLILSVSVPLILSSSCKEEDGPFKQVMSDEEYARCETPILWDTPITVGPCTFILPSKKNISRKQTNWQGADTLLSLKMYAEVTGNPLEQELECALSWEAYIGEREVVGETEVASLPPRSKNTFKLAPEDSTISNVDFTKVRIRLSASDEDFWGKYMKACYDGGSFSFREW